MADKLESTNTENEEGRWTEQDKRIWLHAARRVHNGLRLPPGTYDRLIAHLSTKPLGPSVEKHHVIPLHDRGPDEPENILRLNTTDHILAHLVRYLELGQDKDWKTYVFRKARKVDLTTRGAGSGRSPRTRRKTTYRWYRSF